MNTATVLEDLLQRVNQLEDRLAKVDALPGGLQPECLSVENAAKFLGVRPEAIEHLIRTRQLAYVQLGAQRGRVIPIVALRTLVQEKMQRTGKEMRKERKLP